MLCLKKICSSNQQELHLRFLLVFEQFIALTNKVQIFIRVLVRFNAHCNYNHYKGTCSPTILQLETKVVAHIYFIYTFIVNALNEFMALLLFITTITPRVFFYHDNSACFPCSDWPFSMQTTFITYVSTWIPRRSVCLDKD